MKKFEWGKEEVNSASHTNTNPLKEELISTLETYSEEQKGCILGALKELFDTQYNKTHHLPFHTFTSDESENLSSYLDILLPLFSAGKTHQQNVKQNILNFIDTAKAETKAAPIKKILFISQPGNITIWHHSAFTDFMDKVNRANYINIRDEEGNGWYSETIDFPGWIMDPHGGDFCEIYATEHLLSKKPNAIVILVNGKLRPKFNYIEHDYFNPHAARLTNEAREKLRNVSDEEVVKEYYVSGSEDDF